MDLTSKPVLFHLTVEGRRALGILVPRKGSFRALVVAMDSVGAWILFPGMGTSTAGRGTPVMLLKWEYISTVVFDFKAETPRSRTVPGFVRS